MAIIRCPECSAEISSLATACPQCGLPEPGTIVARSKRYQRDRTVKRTVYLFVALLFVWLFCVGLGVVLIPERYLSPFADIWMVMSLILILVIGTRPGRASFHRLFRSTGRRGS